MLDVTNLIGFAVARPRVLSGLFFNGVDQTPDSGSGTTIGTWNSVPIGSPQADRLVVIAARSFDFPTSTISSATIGGVAATIHINVDNGLLSSAIMSAVVASGTTAAVVITYGANITIPSLYVVGSYSIYGLASSTPVATASDVAVSGNDLSINLDVTGPSGAIVAIGCINNCTSFSWSGATENYDGATLGSIAGIGGLATETPRAITLTGSGTPGNENVLVGASWA